MSDASTSAWARHVHRVYAASAGLFGVAALAIALSDQNLPHAEEDIFRWVNDWPDALRFFLWPIMQLGAFGVVFVVSVATYLIWRRWRVSAAILLSGVACYVIVKIIKSLVERGRPAVYLEHLNLRESFDGGLGFASGHTAIAFATATVLTLVLGTWGRIAAFTLAITVGVGRIYFGAHLPLDVVGGACVGIAVGSIMKIATGADHAVIDEVPQATSA